MISDSFDQCGITSTDNLHNALFNVLRGDKFTEYLEVWRDFSDNESLPDTDYVKESVEWASEEWDSESADEKSEDDERDEGESEEGESKK